MPALLVALALTAAGVTAGGAAALARPEKAKLQLQAERPAYQAGATLRVAALVSIESGWHVNSHKPSFDYLIPTSLELVLPPGWTAAALRYPPDEMKRFTFADQPLAVYDGDVTIDAEVGIPAGAAAGAYPLRAALTYQACNDAQCLPPVTAHADLSIQLRRMSAWRESHADQVAAGGSGGASSRGGAAGTGAATPAPIAGHFAARPGSPGAASPGTPATATPAAPAPAAGSSLWGILLLALAGGLILNAMPCVLPVLSLKVFGLLRSAAHGRREIVRGGLAAVAGILVSFWALAGIAAASAAAGQAAGWGVQFQRPGFVAFLAVVVVLFCLNLWGLFEIRLPQALAQVPGAAPREGLGGHFASGLFATLMATPCSAPFLGTALGFALAQPTPVIFAVFTAVGLGMSLPYLLLAAVPGVERFFPRPGTWMETLRGAMGFLLAGSAIWLLYVLAAQVSPERLALVELGLVAIAFVTWLAGRAAEREAAAGLAGARPGAAPRGAGPAILRGAVPRWGGFAMVAALAVGLIAAAGGGAGRGAARTLMSSGASGAFGAAGSAGLIQWVSFDRARAEALAASGQLVFVDVTADWCFTCKVNERWVLDTPEVAGAFNRHQVLAMRADWTNRDETIAGFLAEHHRFGIPFYLLYRPGQSPYVFSEVPTKKALVQAVAEAAAAKPRRMAPLSSPASSS